jgi:hypothetical protein
MLLQPRMVTPTPTPSLPSLTKLDPAIHLLAKSLLFGLMDRRVKPGDDAY